jgi:hypothetical protein
MWLKSLCTWIETKWATFEAWVASWAPGAKTRIVSGLGALGMAAASMQEYISGLTGLPGNVVSGTQIAVTSLVLFTLAFWLRGIGDRVQARAQ